MPRGATVPDLMRGKRQYYSFINIQPQVITSYSHEEENTHYGQNQQPVQWRQVPHTVLSDHSAFPPKTLPQAQPRLAALLSQEMNRWAYPSHLTLLPCLQYNNLDTQHRIPWSAKPRALRSLSSLKKYSGFGLTLAEAIF